jgi:8-oxo-dGTP pyrophosphatase MutT (NUDIX family)
MSQIVTLSEESVTLPNGVEMKCQFVRHPGGSAVVALNEEGAVCLLRHYRPVTGEWLWELPAGKRDNEEQPLLTAQRELAEEAGLEAIHWAQLGAIYSSPGVFTEVIHLYLATDLKEVGSHPEEHELFELHWLPLTRALAMAQNGEISDAKTIIGIFRAVVRFAA